MNPVNSGRKGSFSHQTQIPGANLNIVRHLSVENDPHDEPHATQSADTDCDLNGNSRHRILQHSTAKYNGGDNGETNPRKEFVLSDEHTDKKICGIPLTRRFRMAIYSFTYFLSGVVYALPAPFYPQVASKKGMALTETGFVFSVFELMIFLTSPLFGSYLTTIGTKFAFTAGITVAGACTILFGTLYMCPAGVTFFVLSILVRAVGATGFSSFLTAVMAAGSAEYPDNVATAMSILEGAFGVGMMLGPSIGGVLYTSGGFGAPFYFVGCLVLVQGMFVYVSMPPPKIDHHGENSGSLLSLLRNPLVAVAVIGTTIGCAGIGFLEPTLAKHLEPFGLSVILISLCFVIVPFGYTLSAPVYGYLSDNKDIYKELMVIGQFIYGIGFILTGPTNLPFLPNQLWFVSIGLVVLGLSFGCTFVPNFKCMLHGAMELGLPENMSTYGLVSGLVNSSYSFGAFLGPMVGGVLVQDLGDRSAYTIIGLMNMAVSIIALVVFGIRRFRGKGYDEEVALVSDSEVAAAYDERTTLITR